MNCEDHLTELEVYEAALEPEVSGDPAAHIVGCARCAAAVEETRGLLASVESFGPESRVPGELEGLLMRRIRMASDRTIPGSPPAGPRVRHWLLRVAAAVILFASGIATHLLWSGSEMPGTAIEATESTPGPALALQRAGTEYVAAIARFVADSGQLSEAERRRGREVAFAAMSGAAFELRLLSNESVEATEMHRLANQARFAENEWGSP